jgi:predicted protein tyrosine phosphatase
MLDIFVGSEKLIEQKTFDEPYILISISSRLSPGWGRKPINLLPDPNRLAALLIQFDDCSPNERLVAKPLLKKEARQIWQFFHQWQDSIELLVVNCEAGISRSPAVAAAILESIGQDSSYCYHRRFMPNFYVKKVMLATHPSREHYLKEEG